MARTWLGLDIGTSAVKALILDDARAVLAEATEPYPVSRPHPLWSEQDAEDWWRGVEAAVAALARAAPDAWRAITGIGLSGQMHGAVVLGRDDRPLRPVILWNDGRSHAEAEALNAADPALAAEVGVYPMPGFTAPKLAWLARHEPDLFAGIDMVLLPKDYVRLKLTGGRVSEMSDAAGTWLLDQAARAWSPRAAAAAGLSLGQLPALVEGSDASGTLRAEIADRWGLARDVVVAGGAGDCAAGGIGIGSIEAGQSFLSLGTSALLFAPTRSYRPNVPSMVHAFCHALPGRWFQMGAMLNGASAFGWVAGLVGEEVGRLSARVDAGYRGPGSVLFLPYLTGERTPHNDPHAKGVFFGLTPDSDAAGVAQAVLEGVAYTFADARDALTTSGTEVGAIGIIGGGARNRLWARIIASVLDRPILRYTGGDKGPAYGAACLARLARTGEPPEAVCIAPAIEEEFLPEPAFVAAYGDRLERFRRLYRVLRPEFAGSG